MIASRLDNFFLFKIFYFQVKECDIEPSVKSDHKIVTLLVHINTSQRERRCSKFKNNLALMDDDYNSKTKIAIADYILNNTATETSPHRRWKALKYFLRDHTFKYSSTNKILSNTKKQIYLL